MMHDPYAVMITGFPLFEGFTVDGARMLLNSGEVKEYAPREAVINEGDAPAFVLLILTGEMEVFVERQGRSFTVSAAGPGTIIGEVAVLCNIPRSASVRASDKSAALQWSATVFRRLLLSNAFLSERIFRESLRTVIEKERVLIESLIERTTS